jgi:acid phosphatase
MPFNATPGKYPPNLGIIKEKVKKYYECGQYHKDLERIIKKALKHFKKVSLTPSSTIVFDIDDTVLQDYTNEKAIAFGYIQELFHTWIVNADAPAIPQVKELYDYLVAQGFKIVFLTGRQEKDYAPTLANLKLRGFTTFAKLIMRNPSEYGITASLYKSERRTQLTRQGFTIIGDIGDQWSDLQGPYTGYKVKLPNYKYVIY